MDLNTIQERRRGGQSLECEFLIMMKSVSACVVMWPDTGESEGCVATCWCNLLTICLTAIVSAPHNVVTCVVQGWFTCVPSN